MNILKPGAHLDHMLRTTRLHHVQLSVMADVKASMVLTISSVLITLCAPQVVKPDLRWAALILILFCFLTIVLAAYAVMPKLPFAFKWSAPPDTNSPLFNILFFGDFVRLDYDEYEAAMEDILNDHAKTYQSMVRELYTLGTFLADKKYRFVRLAYASFIIGLFVSGLIFTMKDSKEKRRSRSKRGGSFFDRRGPDSRRKTYSLDYFAKGGVERRKRTDRRKRRHDRRKEWIRISKWSSIFTDSNSKTDKD